MLEAYRSKQIPFALRQHVPALKEPAESFGDLDQPWNWAPKGKIKKEDIPGYAMSSPQTKRNTGGVSDRSEYD